MLVINFKDKIIKEKKRFGKWRKENNNSYFFRENVTVNNKIFTFVTTDFSVDDCNIQRLVKCFSGKVLSVGNDKFDDMYKAHLFDASSYYKRAYLSSLKRYVECNITDSPCLCVEDYNFTFIQEYYALAEKCRKLILLCNESKESGLFKKHCYENLGLNVILNDYTFAGDCNLSVSFSDIVKSNHSIYYNGEAKCIYADEAYFCGNEFCNTLISKGVSNALACAATEIISEVKIR